MNSKDGPSNALWALCFLTYRTSPLKATPSAEGAVAVAHTFPEETYRQLDGIDYRILNEIAFLSKLQKKRTGSSYCCPGREYLAAKVGCDVGTVSRHTSKLVILGILEKRQRRPIRGIWQTCLYRLKGWASWALAAIAGQLRKIRSNSHRVRPHARIASVRTEIIPPEVPPPIKNTLVAEILSRWKERGKENKQ